MKGEKKICLIQDTYYHNKRNVSPYIYIFKIEMAPGGDKNYLKIFYIDRLGNISTMYQHKWWIYKNLDIVDNQLLNREFIIGVFSV